MLGFTNISSEQYMKRVDANYIVSKWLTRIELQKKYDEIRARYQKQNEWDKKNNTIQNFFSQSVNTNNKEAKQVAVYWESTEDVISEREYMSILKLQATFKMWLALKRLRKTKNINFGSEEPILLSQNAIRRYLTRLKVAHKIIEHREKFKRFSDICKKLKDGYDVIVYSLKFGNNRKALLKIDSKNTNLTYPTTWNLKTIPLRDIYQINKGLSNNYYPLARTEHKLFCLNFEMLGGRRLDIETNTVEDFKELYEGFTLLSKLLLTNHPFYIDSSGYARRAGPSIIKYATSEEEVPVGCKSEADRLRFEEALTKLNDLYNDWSQIYDKEYKDWKKTKKEKRRKEKHLFSRKNTFASSIGNASDYGSEFITKSNLEEKSDFPPLQHSRSVVRRQLESVDENDDIIIDDPIGLDSKTLQKNGYSKVSVDDDFEDVDDDEDFDDEDFDDEDGDNGDDDEEDNDEEEDDDGDDVISDDDDDDELD